MSGFSNLDTLIREGGFYCSHCGRVHRITVEKVILSDGAVSALPGELTRKGLCRPYVFADPNTFRAAGERVCGLLAEAGIEYKKQVINDPRPAPDERTLGDAAMHWDPSRDCVIGVGGGVVNDTCKLLAKLTGKPYFYVATAPSMDGYASTSSSMDVNGLKTSVPADPAGVIILDTSVLAEAPAEMILAGIGDMAAKYISLCEWKIATVITGEYYCPEVAGMMASSLKKVIENSSAAVNRDKEAIGSVAEGLVLAGLAMTCAGVSRPASGMEHYISHIRDMRGLSYGTRTDLHGIQCGFAVLPCLRAYEKLRRARPDRDAAIAALRKARKRDARIRRRRRRGDDIARGERGKIRQGETPRPARPDNRRMGPDLLVYRRTSLLPGIRRILPLDRLPHGTRGDRHDRGRTVQIL